MVNTIVYINGTMVDNITGIQADISTNNTAFGMTSVRVDYETPDGVCTLSSETIIVHGELGITYCVILPVLALAVLLVIVLHTLAGELNYSCQTFQPLCVVFFSGKVKRTTQSG